MEFLPPELNEYVEEHTSPESLLLQELNRETNSRILMPRMLSGHLQGRVLSTLSRMIQPEQILEIGTYTGYSALCLAEGLQDGGTLHTIELNDELSGIVNQYIGKSGLKDNIRCYWGNAVEIIPTIAEEFDLVFIDADKTNYSVYFDLVFNKLKTGGFIIADNVLWSGKVLQTRSEMDDDTRALSDFNDKMKADKRVEHVLLPVRDGLMVIRKNSSTE